MSHLLPSADVKLMVSQATTVDGIRELCSLADDPDFDAYPAVELLQLFNVVGVPAAAAIGDYPDPMNFKLDKLVPGNFVSVADLTLSEKIGNNKKGKPGSKRGEREGRREAQENKLRNNKGTKRKH